MNFKNIFNRNKDKETDNNVPQFDIPANMDSGTTVTVNGQTYRNILGDVSIINNKIFVNGKPLSDLNKLSEKNIIINNKVGDNGVQTGDMTLPAAEEVWIVVEGTKGTVYTTKPQPTPDPDPTPDPEPKPDPEPTGMIIVHAQVPADWTAANAYTWADGSDGDPAWPGAAMEKGADGWYTLAVPSNVNNIIINNGNGGQTQDIKLTGADEIWITVEASESGFIGTLTESNPNTGDDLIAVCAAMLLAGAAMVTTVASKKRFF